MRKAKTKIKNPSHTIMNIKCGVKTKNYGHCIYCDSVLCSKDVDSVCYSCNTQLSFKDNGIEPKFENYKPMGIHNDF